MKARVWQNIILAVLVAIIGYVILLSTNRTGLVDMSIEATLFMTGSLIALNGYFKSKKVSNENFRRFELFYGLTYLIVVISFIMGIGYYIYHPNVLEIGIKDIMENDWLIIMSSIKSFSMIFLILTWSFFYKYLEIEESTAKKVFLYTIGALLYFGASIIIWRLTNDINVLSLGIVVGSVVGIFALISIDKRTRFLTIIFIIYSMIHLIDFYIMGTGKSLTTGVANPVYWGITVLYVLEVKRWINRELSYISR